MVPGTGRSRAPAFNGRCSPGVAALSFTTPKTCGGLAPRRDTCSAVELRICEPVAVRGALARCPVARTLRSSRDAGSRTPFPPVLETGRRAVGSSLCGVVVKPGEPPAFPPAAPE